MPDEAILVESLALVGEAQRVWVYAERGFGIEQDVPADVRDAFDTLVAAGYTNRLVRGNRSG